MSSLSGFARQFLLEHEGVVMEVLRE